MRSTKTGPARARTEPLHRSAVHHQVANGDEKEDLEVEDERDVNDDVVQDNGFAVRASWIQIRDSIKMDGLSKGY